MIVKIRTNEIRWTINWQIKYLIIKDEDNKKRGKYKRNIRNISKQIPLNLHLIA